MNNDRRYLVAQPRPQWIGIYDIEKRDYLCEEYDKDNALSALYHTLAMRLNEHWRDSLADPAVGTTPSLMESTEQEEQ